MTSPWSREAHQARDSAIEEARVLRETPVPGVAPAAEAAPTRSAPQRPSAAFMRRHPAHWIALGFGSGLAPRAPGTVGTLWAWIAFVVLDRWLAPLGPPGWGVVILLGTLLGIWACTRTAQHLGTADPGAIVWDEVIGFWLVLWLLLPASGWLQLVAFGLFRGFDAIKRGPVGWADRRFKLRPGAAIGWRQGFGILFDDIVAAGCTLLCIALVLRFWPALGT
jgi:phosphatidylglycerophosphatase A